MEAAEEMEEEMEEKRLAKVALQAHSRCLRKANCSSFLQQSRNWMCTYNSLVDLVQ